MILHDPKICNSRFQICTQGSFVMSVLKLRGCQQTNNVTPVLYWMCFKTMFPTFNPIISVKSAKDNSTVVTDGRKEDRKVTGLISGPGQWRYYYLSSDVNISTCFSSGNLRATKLEMLSGCHRVVVVESMRESGKRDRMPTCSSVQVELCYKTGMFRDGLGWRHLPRTGVSVEHTVARKSMWNLWDYLDFFSYNMFWSSSKSRH